MVRIRVRTEEIFGLDTQLPGEGLGGRTLLLAFFTIVLLSEGADFGLSQLDSLTQPSRLLQVRGSVLRTLTPGDTSQRSTAQRLKLKRRASLVCTSPITPWLQGKHLLKLAGVCLFSRRFSGFNT